MYRDYSGCYILFCLRLYIAYWFLNETPSYLNSLHKSSIFKFMIFIKQQKGLKLIISSSDTCSHFKRQLKIKFSITFVLIICSTIGGCKIFWKEDGGVTTFSHTTTHVPCTHFFGLNQVVNFFIKWNMYYLYTYLK